MSTTEEKDEGDGGADPPTSTTATPSVKTKPPPHATPQRTRTAFDRRRDGPLARPRWPVTARRRRPRVASREAKFAEPSPEDYKTAQKLSQRSDGSRTPRVPGQGGAPPSADNNV